MNYYGTEEVLKFVSLTATETILWKNKVLIGVAPYESPYIDIEEMIFMDAANVTDMKINCPLTYI